MRRYERTQAKTIELTAWRSKVVGRSDGPGTRDLGGEGGHLGRDGAAELVGMQL